MGIDKKIFIVISSISIIFVYLLVNVLFYFCHKEPYLNSIRTIEVCNDELDVQSILMNLMNIM